MPRSLQEVLDHANDLADQFEHAEPGERKDATSVRELRAAVIKRAEAEAAVADAVAAARSDGQSWTTIAAMLGTSSEAARQRYSPPPRVQAGDTPPSVAPSKAPARKSNRTVNATYSSKTGAVSGIATKPPATKKRSSKGRTKGSK